MGSFGDGGTRTARTDISAVEVKVSGTKPEERQYLFYWEARTRVFSSDD